MSVHLDLPKYKCENCDYFSPMTTKTKEKDGTKIVIGCACKKLCDSLEKLEKEKKEVEESPYISKWNTTWDYKHLIERFEVIKIPKLLYYHEGCPAIDRRIMDLKIYTEEYKFCPDCGEPMIVPKYAEDIKPYRKV